LISSVTVVATADAVNCSSACWADWMTSTLTWDRLGRAEVRLIDLQAGERRVARAAGDVVEAAVDQPQAGERRRVADAGDRLDRRIDLQLIRLDLLAGERAAVGGLDDEVLDVQQQGADL
jgi:hypothetical protein